MTPGNRRLAVLLSGGGTTMVNLQERIRSGVLPAEIAVVVSSRDDAPGLERAAGLGLETRVLSRRGFGRGDTFDAAGYSTALADLLAPFAPGLLVLAGFMTRLAAPILSRWPAVNVHPALLPGFGGAGFYGHRVHEAVLAAGVKLTGATVHFVDADYDRGPIITQEAVAVLEDDTAETLASRVQAAERRIYPAAISLVVSGRVAVEGRRARIMPEAGR
ncbi:MAG TPA: phosphoribosylglycinamide formyltransferase [Polyangia bacterium]|nr:phosphoribosylglycinamide formyltransferase [Polyangia bacterium]